MSCIRALLLPACSKEQSVELPLTGKFSFNACKTYTEFQVIAMLMLVLLAPYFTLERCLVL